MVPGTVVVALDGSTLAERALGPAVELARGFGAHLDLVRATRNRPPDEEAAWLRCLADGLDLDDVGIATPIGFAVNGIVEHLATAVDPVLCLSTRGHTGAGELVLGSVAIDVLRRTEDPVVLVGPSHGAATLADPAAPIVFCFDGSPSARRLEATVADWAGRLRRPVHVTTALHRNREFLGNTPAEAVLHTGLEATDRLLALGIDARHVIVDGLDPARAIADEVDAHGAALVVAGSSRGDPSSMAARLTRSVLGSTAERLVRRSTAPVVVAGSTG